MGVAVKKEKNPAEVGKNLAEKEEERVLALSVLSDGLRGKLKTIIRTPRKRKNSYAASSVNVADGTEVSICILSEGSAPVSRCSFHQKVTNLLTQKDSHKTL
jgi:hypothetical protein